MFLLQTFGGLTLVHATTRAAVGAPRRKPLAVPALVAAGADRGVERDWVSSMLWPELGETRARRALSQALYALRRELGVDVLRDAPRLMIDSSELVSDASDFEALARPGSPRRDLERAASGFPARLVSLGQRLQEAPSEVGTPPGTPASTPSEATSERSSSSSDRSSNFFKRPRALRPKVVRALMAGRARSRCRRPFPRTPPPCTTA